MKRLIFLFAFSIGILAANAQFTDTSGVNAFIRDTIKDRRPDKVTAAQIQKAFLGVSKFLTPNAVTYDSVGNIDILSGLVKFHYSTGTVINTTLKLGTAPTIFPTTKFLMLHSDSSVVQRDFGDFKFNPQEVDTVTTWKYNTAIKTDSALLTRGGTYIANVIETVVPSGLEINDTLNSATYAGGNAFWPVFESCVDDIEVTARLKVISKTANANIGFLLLGATDIYSTTQQDAWWINNRTLMTGWDAHSITTRTSYGFDINPGDSVEIKFRRRLHFYIHTITNLSTSQTFTYVDDGSNVGGGAYVTDIYPGLHLQGIDCILQDYRLIGHGYKADLLVGGSSVFQTQSGNHDFDSTAARRATYMSGMNIVSAAKSANKLQDIQQCLGEIKAMKPRMFGIEAGHNNILMGETVGTYGPVYHQIVDSLISWGITPVCIRPTPSSSADVTPINDFIDSAFGHNPNVKVMNVYNTTALYNTGFAQNRDPQYYVDAAHLNAKGTLELAKGIVSELKNLITNKTIDWTINNADANYTIPYSVYKIKLKATLTADRTITLPPAASNSKAAFTIADFNSGSFHWNANQSIRKPDGTTFTQLANGTSYKISVVDGEYFAEQ